MLFLSLLIRLLEASNFLKILLVGPCSSKIKVNIKIMTKNEEIEAEQAKEDSHVPFTCFHAPLVQPMFVLI